MALKHHWMFESYWQRAAAAATAFCVVASRSIAALFMGTLGGPCLLAGRFAVPFVPGIFTSDTIDASSPSDPVSVAVDSASSSVSVAVVVSLPSAAGASAARSGGVWAGGVGRWSARSSPQVAGAS